MASCREDRPCSSLSPSAAASSAASSASSPAPTSSSRAAGRPLGSAITRKNSRATGVVVLINLPNPSGRSLSYRDFVDIRQLFGGLLHSRPSGARPIVGLLLRSAGRPAATGDGVFRYTCACRNDSETSNERSRHPRPVRPAVQPASGQPDGLHHFLRPADALGPVHPARLRRTRHRQGTPGHG